MVLLIKTALKFVGFVRMENHVTMQTEPAKMDVIRVIKD